MGGSRRIRADAAGAGEEDNYVVCEVGSEMPPARSRNFPPSPGLTGRSWESAKVSHCENSGAIDQIPKRPRCFATRGRADRRDGLGYSRPLHTHGAVRLPPGAVRPGQDADLRLTDFLGRGDRVSSVNGSVEFDPRSRAAARPNALAALAVAARMASHRAGGGGVSSWRRGHAAGVARSGR